LTRLQPQSTAILAFTATARPLRDIGRFLQDTNADWNPELILKSPEFLLAEGVDLDGNGKIDQVTAYCQSDSSMFDDPLRVREQMNRYGEVIGSNRDAEFFHVVTFVEGTGEARLQSFGRNLVEGESEEAPVTYQINLDERGWWEQNHCPDMGQIKLGAYLSAFETNGHDHTDVGVYKDPDYDIIEKEFIGKQMIVTGDRWQSCCVLQRVEYDRDLLNNLLCWEQGDSNPACQLIKPIPGW
jgi:hypothetical protein